MEVVNIGDAEEAEEEEWVAVEGDVDTAVVGREIELKSMYPAI